MVAHPRTVDAPSTISVSSSAMSAGTTIPDKYTCVGAGTSPPLAWSGILYALRSPIGIGAAASPATVVNAVKAAAMAEGALIVPFGRS